MPTHLGCRWRFCRPRPAPAFALPVRPGDAERGQPRDVVEWDAGVAVRVAEDEESLWPGPFPLCSCCTSRISRATTSSTPSVCQHSLTSHFRHGWLACCYVPLTDGMKPSFLQRDWRNRVLTRQKDEEVGDADSRQHSALE